jgi:hypothetical protein
VIKNKFKNALGEEIDPNAILRELVENGAVLIPNYFSAEYVDSVASACLLAESATIDRVGADVGLFDNKFGYDKGLRGQGIARLYNVEEKISEVKKFREDPLSLEIGEAYYARKMRLQTTIFQHNVVCGSGTRDWHIDSWENQLKPLLYLSDCTEENGPFTYLLGSHRNSDFLLRKAFRCWRGEDSTSVSDAEVEFLGLAQKEFCGPKGSLILADTKGIHQGGTLLSGERLALVNYFYA